MPSLNADTSGPMSLSEATSDSSATVNWSSPFICLLSLALLCMTHPKGDIYGFPSSARNYLFSSPIVCASDLIGLVIRFIAYLICHGSPVNAATRIMEVRKLRPKVTWPANDRPTKDQPAEARPENVQSVIRWTAFVVAVLPQVITIFASSGLPWSQRWASMYLFSFLVAAAIKHLADWDSEKLGHLKSQTAPGVPGPHGEQIVSLEFETITQVAATHGQEATNHPELAEEREMSRELEAPVESGRIDTLDTNGDLEDNGAEEPAYMSLEWFLDWFELILSSVAVLLQLTALGWVDLAVLPPDPNHIRKWAYVTLRACAQVLAVIMNLVIASNYTDQKKVTLIGSMFAIFTVLSALHYIGLRFSLMYFMLCLHMSWLAWVLYSVRLTKHYILQCGADIGKWWMNVLAFDFFTRVFFFSSYWYVRHYNRVGTSKPGWLDNFS